MIELTNSVLRTDERHICISRPRRFGKSMAANMLTAYYSRGCDSADLFKNLAISKTEDFEKQALLHCWSIGSPEIHATLDRT